MKKVIHYSNDGHEGDGGDCDSCNNDDDAMIVIRPKGL